VGLSQPASQGIRLLAPYPGGSGSFVAIGWLFTLAAAEAARPRMIGYGRLARALKTAGRASGKYLLFLRQALDRFSYFLSQRLKSGVAHLFFLVRAPLTSSGDR
jgi:hypothetical protein